MIGPCAAVSLVGRNIRAILHRLGEALELFEEQKIYLVTQAANDLNITFVIDEEQGDRLVARLHEIAIRKMTADRVLGPTWEELYGGADKVAVAAQQWWQDRRNELLALGREHGAAFVYDRETLKTRAQSLKALPGIDAVFYAMKANWHPEILQAVPRAGPRLRVRVARRSRARPRDAARASIASASCSRRTSRRAPNTSGRVEQGIWVTLDNLHPLKAWPELFKGRELFVRIDTGHGRGHHDKVRTAGVHSKFGVPLFEMDELERLVKAAGAKVVGLHAHTGSGVFSVDNWQVGGRHADGADAAIQRRAHGRPRRRSRRAGAPRSAGRHAAGVRRDARRAQGRASEAGAVDRAGPLSRCGSRRAAGAGHAAQGQGRSALRRRRDRHELADPPGAVRRASRDPQSDPPRRSGDRSRQRRRADLRVRRSARRRSPAAADARKATSC